jgi:hypothetical protein
MAVKVDTWRASVEEDGDALRIRRRSVPWALAPVAAVGVAALGLGFRADHPLGRLASLALAAMPFAVAAWAMDRERRRLGDRFQRTVTIVKRSTEGYRDGQRAPSVAVDGRGYGAAQVRGAGVEWAWFERDADVPDAEATRSYTVVLYLEGPVAMDVFETRDEAVAAAVAGGIASALDLPPPRTRPRRDTAWHLEGGAVGLGVLGMIAALVAAFASLGVRGPAAGLSDWLWIAAGVALLALFLAGAAVVSARRALARVPRDAPRADDE